MQEKCRLSDTKGVRFYNLNFLDKDFVTMPRKKMSSSKSKQKNLTMKKSTLALAQEVEKDFLGMPAKLAALYRNEVAVLKQQEKKLGTELKKVKADKKAAETKQVALSRAKKTATAKKQIAAAKKASVEAGKMIKTIMVQMDQASKNAHKLAAKQTKFSQISIQLIKLDKQLSKATPKVVKARKKVKAKVAPVTTAAHEASDSSFSTTHIAPINETVETN